MKTLLRRLHHLENARASLEHGPSMADFIWARRQRRLEASGQPEEDLPPVDYTGCRTIADHILRTRHVRMEHQRIGRAL